MDGWIEYRKNGEKPPACELVWVHDGFYHGVTVGSWDGGWDGGWQVDGSDDVGITHWMPLVRPDAPVFDAEDDRGDDHGR